MGAVINPKYVFGTEAKILALTEDSEEWHELGFYYPEDRAYFYQIINGVMSKKADGSIPIGAAGITLNDNVIGGVKSLIEGGDTLNIPENFEYNLYELSIDGVINNDGVINIMQ